MKVALLDYGAGNLHSVARALRHIGADLIIADNADKIGDAERIVFPGVGEAHSAMERLQAGGLDKALQRCFDQQMPILGICVGAQLVLDFSEERVTAGLGLIAGSARMLARRPGLKIPHIGWNDVHYRSGHPLFAGIPQNSCFYFVHSYYPEPKDEYNCLAWSDYGRNFPAAIANRNLFAVQFHPEKSGEIGLRLLANFLSIKAP